MSSFKSIVEAIDGMKEAQEVLQSKYEKRIDSLTERLEEIEAKGARPGKTGPGAGTVAEKEQKDHTKAFLNWVRKPGDASTKQELENLQSHLESKAASVIVATPSSGGYVVPEEIRREVERLELRFSPVRSLVNVIQVGTGDVKEVVNIRGATAGWSSESGARTATLTPDLRENTLTGGELYAYPKASNWALDDVFFDVQRWLTEEAAQAFAVAEGDAVIRGDASNKPTGMLNDPPVARADFDSPIRDKDEYEYINADDDSPYAVSGDGLISLVYRVNSIYRNGASWAMNSATAAAVRKLKTTDGFYLWQMGLADGQPDRLMGYPVAIWEQMDDLDVSGGSNPSFPIAFGNFRRGYTLADRHDMRITIDQVTEPGFTKLYIRKRVYGHPRNNDAVKFLRTAA